MGISLPSIEVLELNEIHGKNLDEIQLPSNNVRVFLTNASNGNLDLIIKLMEKLEKLKVAFIEAISVEKLIKILQHQRGVKKINYNTSYGPLDINKIDFLCKICIENALSIKRSTKSQFLNQINVN